MGGRQEEWRKGERDKDTEETGREGEKETERQRKREGEREKEFWQNKINYYPSWQPTRGI